MADEVILDISALKPDPKNARKHSPRNIEMIERALKEVGPGRSIVIDENKTIMAGNATVEAAKRAGITRVKKIRLRPDELLAVERDDLTERDKTRLALFDNRAGELAEWDTEVMADIVREDEAILTDIFTENDINLYLDEPRVSFQSFDESVADEVEYHECPECGHTWPK